MITDEQSARAFVAARCDARALARLDTFVALLRYENKRQNLVAARSLEEVWMRHIADSAQLLDYVPRGTAPWLDLGTGAGMPGLVIAIMRPDQEITLVEPRAKRIEWLERVCDKFGLARCRVFATRLERVETFKAGVLSARAFAPLPRLLNLSARFSTDRTCWLLPKGRSAAQELADLPPKRRKRFHVEQSVTDPAAGILVGKPRNTAEAGT